MSAIIQAIIPADNFERIRDQIGAILLLELSEQATLDSTFTAPKQVFIESFIDTMPTQYPAVNIRYQQGASQEKSREEKQTHYMHVFHIDLYCSAKSTATMPGYTQATLWLHQLVRKVRSILSNPAYRTVGFTAPFNKRAFINSIEVFEPMGAPDADNVVNARVEYCVEVPEYATVSQIGYPLTDVTATVTLNQSTEGYYWELKQSDITPTVSGSTLTNSFFSNTISEIDIAGEAYLAGTDFTQSGTTITASTFTFTAGTTVTAII